MPLLTVLIRRIVVVTVLLVLTGSTSTNADDVSVQAPPAELKVDPFHKKFVSDATIG